MNKCFLRSSAFSLLLLLTVQFASAQFTGTINVGNGQLYTTLTAADGLFNAINNGNLTGNVTIQITSDVTESGTITLNKWQETGTGNYQIRIVPDGTTERVLSGNAANMFNFSNVRNVVIDGSFSGVGKFLRIINTHKNANTLAFLNDCKTDTVMNCYLEGVDTNTNKSNILIGTTNIIGGTGNDSIAILNNIIKDNAAGYPKNLIRSVGTGSAPNDNCIISGNEFINWSNEAVGLAAGTGDNWKILNNAFYQNPTANITTVIYGIRTIVNSGNGHIIDNNSIGGTAPDRTCTAMKTYSTNMVGTPTIYGISLSGSGSASNPISITKNIISNITGHSVCGINIEAKSNINVDSNFIDNLTAMSVGNYPQSVFGIAIGASNVTVTNNTIRKINDLQTSLYPSAVIGISSNFNSQLIIDHNTIDSILASYSGQNPNYLKEVPVGISINLSNDTTVNIISNNKISNIINTRYFPATGIKYNSSNTSSAKIFNNRIDNVEGLHNGGSTPATYNTLIGINESSDGYDTIYNNTINIGKLTYSSSYIYGIRNAGGSHAYYNNTINLVVQVDNPSFSGGGNTAAFQRESGNVLLKNNILNNARNTGSYSYPYTTKSTAIRNVPSTVNDMSSDYNLLYARDSIVAILGTSAKTFAAWKSATNNDTNSVNAPVTFVSATDLHIDGTNANAWNVYDRGIAIPTIGTDIDGDSRSTVIGTPVTIGADEISIPTSIPLAIDLKTITAKNAGNKNKIDWSTSNERTTDHFELESSTDARNFKKIAGINAKGQASAYSYWDEKAVSGMNYYRLKMIMDDRRFSYSKTVAAEVKSLSGFMISAFPNPAQHKVVLKMEGSIQNNAVIKVTDIAGKVLQTLKVTGYEMEINMDHLANGIYFIKYSDDQQERDIKITKQ